MHTATVLPGEIVADRHLEEVLGRGGEGEVWRARRADGTACALKLIRPDVLVDADEVRRRGAWLVRIDHPGLVRVSRGGRFTSGALRGWGFIEMDLVEGPSLQRRGPLPDALERLRPVAEGLDLLHAGAWSDGVPLIHRDVKPGNLIATTAGLVLVDPSTMRGLDTRDLTRIGTPAYLAPEVLSGRFGPLADVYSLGATALALLTGARGADLRRLIIDAGRADVPGGVVAALDPDPARRPGSCGAVVDRSTVWLPATPTAPAQAIAPVRREAAPGRWWPVLLLALVTAAGVTAATVGPDRFGLSAANIAIALYLLQAIAHGLTGRPVAGLLAPPWAWGALIAHTAAVPGRRRRWLADVVAGAVLAATAWLVGAAAGVRAPVDMGVEVVAVAWSLVALARLGVTSTPLWWLLRLLLLPLRLLGGVPRALVGAEGAHDDGGCDSRAA